MTSAKPQYRRTEEELVTYTYTCICIGGSHREPQVLRSVMIYTHTPLTLWIPLRVESLTVRRLPAALPAFLVYVGTCCEWSNRTYMGNESPSHMHFLTPLASESTTKPQVNSYPGVRPGNSLTILRSLTVVVPSFKVCISSRFSIRTSMGYTGRRN